jgi:hypothetical protein
MIIVAIDPGLKGGLAKIAVNSRYVGFAWRKMPTYKAFFSDAKKRKATGLVDIEAVRSWISVCDALVIERQAPMPRQGLVSTFTIGVNYGQLLTLTRVYPSFVASPPIWKKTMGLGAEKAEATALARRIFGEGSPDADGPAEALLMCYWMHRVSNERKSAQGFRIESHFPREKRAVLKGSGSGGSGSVDFKHFASDALVRGWNPRRIG